jgi:hypothetical protein
MDLGWIGHVAEIKDNRPFLGSGPMKKGKKGWLR